MTRLQAPTTRAFAPWMNRNARQSRARIVNTHHRELAKHTSRFPHRHRLHECTRAIHHIIEYHSHRSLVARFDILPFTRRLRSPRRGPSGQSSKKSFWRDTKICRFFCTAKRRFYRAYGSPTRARDVAPTRRRALIDALVFIASMRAVARRASRRTRPWIARAFEIRTVAREHPRVCAIADSVARAEYPHSATRRARVDGRHGRQTRAGGWRFFPSRG